MSKKQIAKLPSAKEYLPGTKKKVDGKTFMVVGTYSNYGNIIKSTQRWEKLTKSNSKYLDTKNTVAKLARRCSKNKCPPIKRSKKRSVKRSKRRSIKRSVKRSVKRSKKRSVKKVSKKRSLRTPSINKRSPKPLKHNRPSPSVSATEYAVGIVKTGNDGNKYIIKKTSNGNKRWVRY